MKVALAQINPTVGDIEGNLQRIIEILADYHGKTDLIIFPELCLVGYPPQDLLERAWFIKQAEQAVNRLMEASSRYPETGIICGVPLPTGRKSGKGLINAAVLIYQGRKVFTQAKSLLPTYDVFDEARYFDPASEGDVVRFKDQLLGISICEDAWNDPDLWPFSKEYEIDPLSKLADRGAALMVNIAASPYHLGKEEIRYRLIKNRARKHRIPFIFVNQVGGNDELIFDGGSMVFNEDGVPLKIAPYFQEQILEVDLEEPGNPALEKPRDRMESLYSALVLGIKDYLRKCGFQKAVLGLSGGIDSALACCLAVDALGKENVLGIAMPSPYSSLGSVEDSRELARNLGIDFKVIPIDAIFESYLKTLGDGFGGVEPGIAEENIQARIRGNILMAFANKYGYITLATGNKSELAIGYCTLYGDMCGGLSAISDLPKTVVYELAGFINRDQERIPRSIIEKAPSAELKPNQRDQDTLPPYPVLDKILQHYVEDGFSVAEIIALNFDPETVEWVARTVDRSEYKRKQAVPGLKISPKAFGGGRRMPVAKKIKY
ncbi:MAG: NAD+ synthase [Firmicutes bacterium]|nr:NAD+ synthase [Bacillota bacterium]